MDLFGLAAVIFALTGLVAVLCIALYFLKDKLAEILKANAAVGVAREERLKATALAEEEAYTKQRVSDDEQRTIRRRLELEHELAFKEGQRRFKAEMAEKGYLVDAYGNWRPVTKDSSDDTGG